jgi:hypothetical protein
MTPGFPSFHRWGIWPHRILDLHCMLGRPIGRGGRNAPMVRNRLQSTLE